MKYVAKNLTSYCEQILIMVRTAALENIKTLAPNGAKWERRSNNLQTMTQVALGNKQLLN